MFGIGMSELLVIACAAIILVRPADLPKLLRLLGKAYGRAKAYYDRLSAAKDEMLGDIVEEDRGKEEPGGGRPGDEESFRPYE